ncbi:MAG: CocE/NonD family hydrolase [Deltaproteobacteria bacterium]
MFTQKWKTSERKYEMIEKRDIQVPTRDGTILVGNIFFPKSEERFPVILGCSPYNKELQTAPLWPTAHDSLRGFIEAGDPAFFVRRGYVQAVFNVRGTGKSQGKFQMLGPLEARDIYDLIEWLGAQPWSNGNVGMFGVSYFSMIAQKTAELNPPSLKAIFSPFALTDFYRDHRYHGGMLSHGFLKHWGKHLDNVRPLNWSKEHWGEEAYRKAIDTALRSEDVVAIPHLREALENPDQGWNIIVVDGILNDLDGEYYRERSVNYENTRVPAYLGACWANYALHLPGAFRSWKLWKGPKKMVIGPPLYLDRPLYQYQYESLRWFDYWLKGVENGIMDEPPIRLFIPPTGEWKIANQWPLPETRWTPFYLHANGLLSEHELWSNEGCDNFNDSTFVHESLTYRTPPLVENTEVIGPIIVNFYASSTDTEMLFFTTLLVIDPEGTEHELTRGWLKASQRRLRPDSLPWEPILEHSQRESLEPGAVYELHFDMVPTGRLFQKGDRIGIRIKSSDDEKALNRFQAQGRNHVWRQMPTRVTIYHDEAHPSCIWLPVTRGNVIGTYISGGLLPVPGTEPGVLPSGLIDMPKEIK